MVDQAIGAEELKEYHADEDLADEVAGKEAESKEIAETNASVVEQQGQTQRQGNLKRQKCDGVDGGVQDRQAEKEIVREQEAIVGPGRRRRPCRVRWFVKA